MPSAGGDTVTVEVGDQTTEGRRAPTGLLTPSRLRDLPTRQRWWLLGLAALVTAPFVVAAFQAQADGWYPTGDNGTMLTVARQVFTHDTPLTGEVASGTRYGAHPFHPGPAVYYVLAPFVEVFGGTWGMLLGAAFVSVGALLVSGYAALRAAGPAAAVLAWLTALSMVVSLGGTAFLYPPFKTTLSLLVMVACFHLCAALLAGRSSLLPLWAFAVTFPTAATMRYALPVAAVAGATVLAIVGRRWWRARLEAPDDHDGRPGPLDALVTALRPNGPEKRSLAIAAVVVAVCWWGPVWDVVTNGGGNVRELYRASRAASEQVDGFGQALGQQAKALLFDPVQSAAQFHTSSAPYLAGSALLLTGIVALVVVSRHRLGRPQWAYLFVAASALLAMLAAMATTPSDEGFGVYRTLGSAPTAAIVLFAGLLVAGVTASPHLVGRRRAVSAVGVGALAAMVIAVAVPGPIDAGTEQYPFAFRATRTLVDQAAPEMVSDGRWATWVIGGRTTPTIFVGFKAGLEANGIDTGVDAGAPGFGADDGRDPKPPAGTVIVTATELPAPTGDWQEVATYQPPNRSTEDARAVADELLAFAEETRPLPLGAFTNTVPRILCPELAASAFEGPCPAAEAVLASDNPVAALPAEAVALVYLVQFGDDTQFPVIDGSRPPDDLLDRAASLWDDLPLSAYVLRTDDQSATRG